LKISKNHFNTAREPARSGAADAIRPFHVSGMWQTEDEVSDTKQPEVISMRTHLLHVVTIMAITLLVCATAVGVAAAQPVKNIVLVHGAFADGSSWSKVIPILQAKGYNVTAVQNPLTSLADDVAATQRALALQDGPTILVGHSWAGVVITEAGMDSKVVGLVYVAAFAPDQGETVAELGKAYPAPPALAAPTVDKEGFLTLSADAFKKFGSDLPESDALVAAATQGPINASAFGAQVSAVAWKTKPSWYIVSTLDQAIAPDEERFFAKRMKATTTELKASHVAMLSQPQAVAAVIIDAATKANVTKASGR
jgi:pimeloyl-ACP methyl ester carboxylesterase